MRLRSLGLAFGLLFCAFLISCGGGGGTPPVTPLSITTASPLPQGMTGTGYSATLAATGGKTPYTWSVTTGNLPAGLTLSAAGVISGTPSAAGTSNFTVQLADSESMPQMTTQPLTLAISGGQLKITSTLPSGQVGVPYSFQTTASGGIPPYSWSVVSGALPGGLTLSASGVLSGTPAAAGNFNPVIQVADSTTTNTFQQNLPIVINPATGSLPNGNYSFVFSGTNSKNAPVAIDGSFALLSGTVFAGFYDENASPSAPALDQTIMGGTVTANPNGLGTLKLTLTVGSAVTFAYAIPSSIGTVGNDSDIRIIEFDDSSGTGMRGSGVLKYQSGIGDTSAIRGSYAFRLSGASSSAAPTAIAGSLVLDGKGNVTSGEADRNDNGTVANVASVTGTYTVDAIGRGLLKLNLNGTTYSYSFYQVSPGELLAISVDQVSSTIPLVSGSILQQAGTPFSNASLKGTGVLELNGLAAVSGNTTPDLTLGLATTDGSGDFAVSYDEYKNQTLSQQSFTGKYAVDAATGRVAVTSGGTPAILYLVSGSQAFVLGGDSSASSGLLEAQSGSPFANASFKGNYLGGSFTLASPAVTHEVGQAAADGSGNLVIAFDSSGPKGLVTSGTLTGTYVVDSHGRAVVTAADGATRIFYVVSPTKVAFLSGADGYVGSFEQ